MAELHDGKKAADRERLAARRMADDKESEQQKLLHDEKRFQATEQRNVRVLTHRIDQGHQAEELVVRNGMRQLQALVKYDGMKEREN